MPDQPDVFGEDLLTTTEAAALLGVSPSAFADYKRRDWIRPAFRKGRSQFYRRTDVDALHRKLHPHERNGGLQRRG